MSGPASRVTGGLESRRDFRLGIALVLALTVHAAVILGIDLPAPESGFGTPAIDIRLIVESAPAPSAETGRETVPDSAGKQPASAVPDPVRREFQQTGLNPGASATAVSLPERDTAPRPEGPPPASPVTGRPTARQTPSPNLETAATTRGSGLSYTQLAKEIANAHTQRERQNAFGAGGTRTKRLTSTSAKSAAEAAYLDMWRQKIERIGRANYPPGGISGELLLLAVIRRDGALQEVRVLESTGYPALDAAATRTVRLAAPYTPFPPEMRKAYDRLEIVRRWRFAREGALLP